MKRHETAPQGLGEDVRLTLRDRIKEPAEKSTGEQGIGTTSAFETCENKPVRAGSYPPVAAGYIHQQDEAGQKHENEEPNRIADAHSISLSATSLLITMTD